ncbi:MAG: hypothetical protein ABH812_03060, partial [bacterium]
TEPKSVNEIFLVQNSTTKDYVSQNKNLYNFFHLWRVPFNVNPLLRSYVFEELLRNKIDARARIFKKKKDGLTFKHIKKFNYDFLEIK